MDGSPGGLLSWASSRSSLQGRTSASSLLDGADNSTPGPGSLQRGAISLSHSASLPADETGFGMRPCSACAVSLILGSVGNMAPDFGSSRIRISHLIDQVS